MAKKLLFSLFIVLMVLASVKSNPYPQGSSRLTIQEAQNMLVGNTEDPSKRDCVCMNWRRCADVNSDVRCHPDYVIVCCRTPLY